MVVLGAAAQMGRVSIRFPLVKGSHEIRPVANGCRDGRIPPSHSQDSGGDVEAGLDDPLVQRGPG